MEGKSKSCSLKHAGFFFFFFEKCQTRSFSLETLRNSEVSVRKKKKNTRPQMWQWIKPPPQKKNGSNFCLLNLGVWAWWGFHCRNESSVMCSDFQLLQDGETFCRLLNRLFWKGTVITVIFNFYCVKLKDQCTKMSLPYLKTRPRLWGLD